MQIPSAGYSTALESHRSVSSRTNQVTARLGSGSRSPSPSDDPVLWGEVERLRTSAARLQTFSDNLNRAALSTRVALSSMKASDAQLGEMQVSLNRALDEPPGSTARQSALEQFNEYHRLADDYSKPDELDARKLLDDPSRFESAGALEVAAGENNFQIRLAHRPIHLGSGGLDVPRAGDPLPSDPLGGPVIADIANATDDELREMAELLDAARTRLKEQRAGLAADVVAVERQELQGESVETLNESFADDLNASDLVADATLAQALSLRSNLAISGLSGLSQTHNLVLQLLR